MAGLGKTTRRAVLIGVASFAGSMAVGYWYVDRPYRNPLEDDLADGEATFNPFVKIGSDNSITVVVPRAEMGQGVATTLAAMVAEELDVPLEMLRVEHGPTSWAYYNGALLDERYSWLDERIVAELGRFALGKVAKLLGMQATVGSTSVRDGFDRMRRAGAAARIMLMEAAATRLGVDAGDLTTHNATVVHAASGRSISYGELSVEAAKRSLPGSIKLKEEAEWKILRKPQKRVDLRAKVTGAPIYGVDVQLPGMLFGTVRMNRIYWEKPTKVDLSKAQAVKGVIKIIPLSTLYGHGFGVIADNTWTAFRAAELIEADWGKPAYPSDTAALEKTLTDALTRDDADLDRDDGDVDAAFAKAPAGRIIQADYGVPLLAHLCMEPQNATARYARGKLEIWAPNQLPTVVQQVTATAVGLPLQDVTLHTTFLGCGFGRREPDTTIYAAMMAKAVEGRPVKVIWSREEDVRHDRYRPPARGRFRALIGENGIPEALDMRIASPSIFTSITRRTFPSTPTSGPDPIITQGLRDQPYAIPNYRVAGVKLDPNVPIGFWRSVGSSYTCFFQECFLDEIAHGNGMDPIQMRRPLMKDFPSALAVVDRIAAMSAWGEPLPPGKAKGFAFNGGFGSWTAEVVQIAQTEGGLRIEKVWIVADVGTALDPRIIESQLVSGAIFGLSSAMNQEITLSGGTVDQSNLHDFDAMRMSQCPEFDVAILENNPKIGGVGEAGTPPAIAALANAVFALTGKRVRQMPLSKEVTFA